MEQPKNLLPFPVFLTITSPFPHFGHFIPIFSTYFSVNLQSGNREQEINFPNLPILTTSSPFLHSGHALPNFSTSIFTLFAFSTEASFPANGSQNFFILSCQDTFPSATLSRSASISAVNA